MSKKKKIIILVVVIAIIAVASFTGVYIYRQDQRQRAIAAATAKIDAISASFNESQDRAEKLQLLQDIQKLHVEDNLAKVSADLSDKYLSVIADFQKFFVNDYETTIKSNTVTVDTAIKADLEKCKSNLSACLRNISVEGAITVPEDGGKGYIDQIDALIASYDAKIAEITAAAKAETERIAAEEAAKKANEGTSKHQGDQAAKSNVGKNSGNSGAVSQGGEAGGGSGSSDNNANDSSNSNSAAPTEATAPPKGPKPAKYTVIQADDFPRDGWSWRRSVFCWHVSYTEWGGADGRELVAVDWDVFPDSGKVVGAKENAKRFLPPKPTLEESKSMIPYGEDVFFIRYGHTTLYVCLED